MTDLRKPVIKLKPLFAEGLFIRFNLLSEKFNFREAGRLRFPYDILMGKDQTVF